MEDITMEVNNHSIHTGLENAGSPRKQRRKQKEPKRMKFSIDRHEKVSQQERKKQSDVRWTETSNILEKAASKRSFFESESDFEGDCVAKKGWKKLKRYYEKEQEEIFGPIGRKFSPKSFDSADYLSNSTSNISSPTSSLDLEKAPSIIPTNGNGNVLKPGSLPKQVTRPYFLDSSEKQTQRNNEELTSSSKTSKKAQNFNRSRRIVANARERNRVHTISAAFEGLRRAVPCYSHNQKLSKLAILRIACSYILALANLADLNYAPGQKQMSFRECVDLCTGTLQSEGRSKRRKTQGE